MDLMMDLVALAAVQLSLSALNLRRLLPGLLLLSSCTVAAEAMGGVWSRWLHLPLMILCAAAVTGERRCGRILQAALCMLCCYSLCAGFCLLGGIPAALAGAGAFALLLRRHRHLACRWNIEVQLQLNGLQFSFPALIDTGNRLREQKSSLPVLIVEDSAAPQLASIVLSLPEEQKRALPYGVLGSSGKLICCRSESVHILLPGISPVPAPDCWVAVYPGRIPGSTRALAPPEFADAVQQAATNQGFLNRSRRVFYGFFKCKAVHLRVGGADAQGFGVLYRRQ